MAKVTVFNVEFPESIAEATTDLQNHKVCRKDLTEGH